MALFWIENGCKENRIKRKYQQLKCYKTEDCGICVSLYAKSLLILQYQIFDLILSTRCVCSKVNFPHFRFENGTTWTGSSKVYNSFNISYFLNIFWVSHIRYDLPVMLTRLVLWQSLSTRAEQRTLSFIISSHLVNGRFVVIIVALLPDRNDRWLKSSSAPSLSKLTYPISSQITRSYFLNLYSSDCINNSILQQILYSRKFQFLEARGNDLIFSCIAIHSLCPPCRYFAIWSLFPLHFPTATGYHPIPSLFQGTHQSFDPP